MKINIFLSLLFISIIAQSQIVDIPDANFKNALVNENVVDTDGDGYGDEDADTNNDGEIQVSEAEAVLRLEINDFDIVSLEGLQSFVNLVYFSCISINATTLDATSLVNLNELLCFYGDFETIDVTNCPNLIILACGSNTLNSLDVTQNPLLEYLDCGVNNLQTLDISQNDELVTLGFHMNSISEINLEQKENLETIQCLNNNLTNLDTSQNPILNFLDCRNNNLNSIDLSQNPNLEKFWGSDNNLIYLNIKNGNNSNIGTMQTLNINLNCIIVDDQNASRPECDGLYGWCKEEVTVYSENEDCFLGLEDYYNNFFTIYPNPTKKTLFIENQHPIETIKIYTLQGQLISSSTPLRKQEVSSNNIDVSQLSAGLYFVQVTVAGKTETKKFVKE